MGDSQGQSFGEDWKSEKRSEGYSKAQVRAALHAHSESLHGSHGNRLFVLQVVRGLQLGRPPSGEHRPSVHADREYSSASVCLPHQHVHALCSVRWTDHWTTATLTTSRWTPTALLLTKSLAGTLSFSGKDTGPQSWKKGKKTNSIHISSWKSVILCGIFALIPQRKQIYFTAVFIKL